MSPSVFSLKKDIDRTSCRWPLEQRFLFRGDPTLKYLFDSLRHQPKQVVVGGAVRHFRLLKWLHAKTIFYWSAGRTTQTSFSEFAIVFRSEMVYRSCLPVVSDWRLTNVRFSSSTSSSQNRLLRGLKISAHKCPNGIVCWCNSIVLGYYKHPIAFIRIPQLLHNLPRSLHSSFILLRNVAWERSTCWPASHWYSRILQTDILTLIYNDRLRKTLQGMN